MRGFAHLRPRTTRIGCIARIRNSVAIATHDFFQEKGFIYVNTPIITTSDCEGGGNMFQVSTLLPSSTDPYTNDGKLNFDYSNDFFEKPAFLTVSGQLCLEAYACALTDVYTFGPCFRKEEDESNTSLSEFWMVEPEICMIIPFNKRFR